MNTLCSFFIIDVTLKMFTDNVNQFLLKKRYIDNKLIIYLYLVFNSSPEVT